MASFTLMVIHYLADRMPYGDKSTSKGGLLVWMDDLNMTIIISTSSHLTHPSIHPYVAEPVGKQTKRAWGAESVIVSLTLFHPRYSEIAQKMRRHIHTYIHVKATGVPFLSALLPT